MTSQHTPDAVAAVDVPASIGASSMAASDFASDVGPRTLGEAGRAYLGRLRGGDVGALPALLGMLVLLVIFDRVSPVFFTTGNLANLPRQGAGFILIAMGLVFILLLGEIDLSAGTAGGVCAATMGLVLSKGGDLRLALGGRTFLVLLVLLGLALLVAVHSRLWPAVLVVGVGGALMLTDLGKHQVVAIYLAVATGVAIGLLTGFLVARVGIPSFVVTLALFLAWQGVLLKFLGEGGALNVARFDKVFGLANENFSPAQGWALLVVLLGGYLGYTIWRSISRRRENLSAEPLSLVLLRGAALTLVGVGAVYFLNQPRGGRGAIQGIPWVVALILVLMVFWTLVLSKSSFGRHLYAVGGNTEAARRAGIDVPRIKLAAFAIGSGMAALGGVALSSRLGSIPSDLGGGNTLLYAVAAAVIGGTSLFGGKGKVRDAVIGGLVISLIPNGLGLKPNLGSAYDFMITGMVLLVAASVDALSRKRAAASGV
jgi:D-xylose transport system permease protein